jgi:hypothetical protein
MSKTNNVLLDINLRIKETSYKKLKSIKVWYTNTTKEKTNHKELLDYIINEFIKYKKLGYLNNGEIEQELQNCKDWIKHYRIDNNFEPTIYEKIEAVKQYFENNNNKKTTNEIIDYCLGLLFDLYPEINEILEKNKIPEKKKEIGIAEKNRQMEKLGRVL